jgi:hypothetical protein
MIKTEHARIKLNLYRMIYYDSEGQKFNVTPTHDILITVKFPEFN